jgi:sulfatase maturation enzyme AslB (radical SAM superfamily)
MIRDNFCSSPWYHLRITNSGELRYCRFAIDHSTPRGHIRDQAPLEFFRNGMTPVRQQMLSGERPAGCRECHVMEQHGKVSGRQRQLLKTGVRLDEFERTMISSPWVSVWQQVDQDLDLAPQDWQVDLGNYCNSACVFCTPEDSSRLAQQHRQLGILKNTVPLNWTDDDALVHRFLEMLEHSPKLRYMHFIGGETLITPAFETILRKIVDLGRAGEVTIGFTTNLTVWDQHIVDLLCQFESVNLNVSIESMDRVNDYVRWPSQIDQVRATLERWMSLADTQGWLPTLRVTPTALSIHRVKTVYQFAAEHNLNVESCNFLYRPQFMRPTVLPDHVRQAIADELEQWIQEMDCVGSQILNLRHPDYRSLAAVQDAASYVEYLRHAPDESGNMGDLARYLKQLDHLRGNCVFDYVPEYEDLLRSAGY